MDSDAIQRLCIAGTDMYLAFLDKNKKGLDKVEVTHLTRESNASHRGKPLFRFKLAGPLFDPDCVSLELTPPGQTYGPECFKVRKYDKINDVLIVQVLKSELNLDDRPPESVHIVSDLRFLVRNVKSWFASNGRDLQLPCRTSEVPETRCTAAGRQQSVVLEPCQEAAVSASLQHPLTYVWGPPGTGKTKYALTAAVLQLLLEDKRVGLFAPTNNALEQALTAILRAAETAGIAREKFLRVGHPSPEFATAFPGVCERQNLQKQVRNIRDQITICTTVLNWRRGTTVLGSAATLRHEVGNLQNMLGERRRLYVDLARLRRSPLSKVIHHLDGSIRAMTEKVTSFEDDINGQLEMIRHIHTESPQLNAIIERVTFTNVETIETDVVRLEKVVQEYLDVSRAQAEAYAGQTDEDIRELITHLEQEITQIEEEVTVERIKSASVIGMTLDCFIGQYRETSLSLDHIFLDEAGYAPLVKALTLCRGRVPLTFLGDHKQLGPVCEMNGQRLVSQQNASAVIWKRPALFLDTVFLAKSQDNLITELHKTDEPKCSSFRRVALNRTFRFGQKLANVLSACVYRDVELVAAGHHGDLDIVCLNAVPSEKPVDGHQNHAEVDCIASYIDAHPELRETDDGTYAILTPYKKQVSLLRKRLPKSCRQGRILTVHKAQGQEWDTVFFSVVDGRFNRPWFTDTTNLRSGGLHVVNTAVSRARKCLVIVCDTDYWSHPNRGGQLISSLLSIAE